MGTLKNSLTRTGSSRSSLNGSPRLSKDLSRNSSRRSSRSESMRDEQALQSTLSRKDFSGSLPPSGKAASRAHHASAHRKGPVDSIEERLREEVAIRKKEEQRHTEMLAKEEEDLLKFEALHKQLHGKEYGYDHKGQVTASWCHHQLNQSLLHKPDVQLHAELYAICKVSVHDFARSCSSVSRTSRLP